MNAATVVWLVVLVALLVAVPAHRAPAVRPHGPNARPRALPEARQAARPAARRGRGPVPDPARRDPPPERRPAHARRVAAGSSRTRCAPSRRKAGERRCQRACRARRARSRSSSSGRSRAGDLVGHGLDALLADRGEPRARGADVASSGARSTCSTRARRSTRLAARSSRSVPLTSSIAWSTAAPEPIRRGPRTSLTTSRTRAADRPRDPYHTVCSGILSRHTTTACGAATGERCAVPSAARVTRGSWTRGTSTTRRRSAAAGSAPPAPTRFTTYERVEAARLVVVKRDGTRQEFDRDKLASRPAQGAHPPPRRRRRRRPGRRRDRGRAALGSGVSEIPSSPDRRPRDGQAPRRSTTSPTSGSPASTRASRTSRTSSARSTRCIAEHAVTPEAGAARPDERPVRSRHPDASSRPAGSGSTRTIPRTSSRRRSTSTSTAASASSATTATRSSTSATPQPDLTEMLTIADDEPFILHPGEFVLGQTLEWVELPDDLVARLEGK